MNLLDRADLTREVGKEQFKRLFPELARRLRRLQVQCRERKVPVQIAIEGWDAAGKGTAISSIVEHLDPRGYRVHAACFPTDEEWARPFLWRFWAKLPNDGDFAIYDRSWYGRVLVDRFDELIPKKAWRRGYEEINRFERLLVDHGGVVVKLFLHISKKEQKKRLKAFLKDKFTRWRVEKKDIVNHQHYDAWRKIYAETFRHTSTPWAPWTVVEAEDWRHAAIKSVGAIIAAVERRLKGLKPRTDTHRPLAALDVEPRSILAAVDLTKRLDKEEYERELARYQARFRELAFAMFKRQIPCVIGIEGWDAAGKGGAIKRLIAPLDPRSYDVILVGVPKGEELTHHYLWRHWKPVPRAGHIAIYDRTWYGRVLIDLVDKFCTRADVNRAYREIREFEEMLLARGAVLAKFWIHISSEEQLRRFEERQTDETKSYKLTPDDWVNRSHQDEYVALFGEAYLRTSTKQAPWTIVEGNDKRWARIKVLKTVCRAVEKRLERE